MPRLFSLLLIAFCASFSASAPASRPADGGAEAGRILAELPVSKPVDQLKQLRRLAELGPAGRNMAAVAVRPELVGLRQKELLAEMGEPGLQALTALALRIHVEARRDESVMAGLVELARELAPGGRTGLIDLGQWFDGGTEQEEGKLVRATAWAGDGEPGRAQSVQTLTARGPRVFINGKPAEPLSEPRVEDGATRQSFQHPDDPNLRVKVYHSAGSMAAFEQKSAKLEILAPLSAAGAGPRLIEHGETPLSGVGRAYYYVQEIVKGAKLQDLAYDAAAAGRVKDLFDRLAGQGLSLTVPASGQSWLLSNLMIGETPAGGLAAYLLGGAVETAEPAAAAADAAMLRGLLDERRDGFQPAAAVGPVAAPRREKLAATAELGPAAAALSAASPAALAKALERHGLGEASAIGAGSSETVLSFADEAAAFVAVERLLLDPAVTSVKVSPALKERVEAAGAKRLAALLPLLPAGEVRDALIASISGDAYARTEGAEVASMLGLLRPVKGAQAVLERLPVQAWRRLERADLESLLKRWAGTALEAAAPILAGTWLRARHGAEGAEPADAAADALALAKNVSREAVALAAGALWPDVLSKLPASDPRRAELEAYVPLEWLVGKDVREIFTFGLNPQIQLNAVEVRLNEERPLTVRELVYILEKMPLGVDWGWSGESEPRVVEFYARAAELGAVLQRGKGEKAFLFKDVPLAAKAIRHTRPAAGDEKLLERVPELARRVLAKSGERNGFGPDHPRRLEALLFEEYRRLSQAGAEAAPASPSSLSAVFDPGLTPFAQLEALDRFLDEAASLSSADLIQILERMPKSQDWGWKDPAQIGPVFERMKELGVGGHWDMPDFMFMDVGLVAKAFNRTTGVPADAELLAGAPKLAHAIVDASGELKDKTPDYVAELRRLIAKEFAEMLARSGIAK